MPPASSRRNFLERCSALLVTSPVTRDRAALDPAFEPSYVKLHRTGELRRRAEALFGLMESCRLCPRECGADRVAGEEGFCGASGRLRIASFHPHHGEERPLVGSGGSGTVFFTHCSLRCVFCINWEISQRGDGQDRGVEELAHMMLRLQETGCHNVNIVTPTHYSAHVVQALDLAAAKGLRLPLVYNTCGWERLEILRDAGRRRGHLPARLQVRRRRHGRPVLLRAPRPTPSSPGGRSWRCTARWGWPGPPRTASCTGG